MGTEHVRLLPTLAEDEHSGRSGLFAAIVTTSADAIICIDTSRRIVEFNQGAERMFLRSRDDVLGQPVELLIPESFRSAHVKHVESYAAEGEPRRMAQERPAVRGVRSNGEEFAAEATIARHELGGQRLFSVIVRDLTEQARLDAEVEKRWRELFEAASEGIFIANHDGRYTDVNRAACELLGYRRDELLEMTIRDLIPADQAERLAESKQQLETGGVHIAEWSLRSKDGAYVPVEVSAKILPDGRWTAFVRDIRDRKAVEEALRIDQQRLRVALTGSPVSAFAQDVDLRYTWSFNPPAPLSPSDVIGKTAEDFTHSELTRNVVDIKRRVIATGVPARELICNVIGGRERYFDTTNEPLRDSAGNIVGITGASWDVTDRKRAEDEQHLFAKVSAALDAKMLDWTDLLASNVAALALGMLADFCVAEIVDEQGTVHHRDVVHSDPANATVCAALRSIEIDPERPHLASEVFRTRRPLLVEHVSPNYLASVAQSDRHLELLSALGLRSLITVPLVSRGRLLGAYVLGSSRREYEPDDLRIATEFAERVALAIANARLHRDLERALQARADVLAIVAHDLRNPLNSILLQSELLSSKIKENVREDGLERIRGSARRMNRLIQDLLDVVRMQAHEPLAIRLDDVAPRAVAEEILSSLQPQAALSLLELQLECDTDLSIRADHDRLVQVLDNLVGNAIKFSPRGASVVVGVHQRDSDVEFSVADSGPGIAPEQIEHLFDRFWQADRTDRRGSGLGLSVVKGIVEAHHGRVWVDARVGQGSTFYFTIPIHST